MSSVATDSNQSVSLQPFDVAAAVSGPVTVLLPLITAAVTVAVTIIAVAVVIAVAVANVVTAMAVTVVYSGCMCDRVS